MKLVTFALSFLTSISVLGAPAKSSANSIGSKYGNKCMTAQFYCVLPDRGAVGSECYCSMPVPSNKGKFIYVDGKVEDFEPKLDYPGRLKASPSSSNPPKQSKSQN